jgi:hypothetical protein
MRENFANWDWNSFKSSANFVLVRVGDGNRGIRRTSKAGGSESSPAPWGGYPTPGLDFAISCGDAYRGTNGRSWPA